MRRVHNRDQADAARRWGFVFAITRTWQTGEERTLNNLVPQVPR